MIFKKSEKKIAEISGSTFEEIGKILKKRRINDDCYILRTRIESLNDAIKINNLNKINEVLEDDPADADKDLEIKLLNNKKIGDEKQEMVKNIFVENFVKKKKYSK